MRFNLNPQRLPSAILKHAFLKIKSTTKATDTCLHQERSSFFFPAHPGSSAFILSPEDECVGERRRRLSRPCRDLDEAVCSQRERRVIARFGEEAVEVCAFVGRPITRSEEYDNMYYDLVDSDSISEDEDEDEDFEGFSSEDEEESEETYADFE